MAKKKSKEELDIDNDLDMGEESESAGGNKFLNILIVLAVIIVWLAMGRVRHWYLIKRSGHEAL